MVKDTYKNPSCPIKNLCSVDLSHSISEIVSSKGSQLDGREILVQELYTRVTVEVIMEC